MPGHRWTPLVAATAVSMLVAPLAAMGAPHHADSVATVAHDGPFGIAMGEPLSEVGPVNPQGAGDYTVLKPPRPSPLFASVIIEAFPSTGVCTIIGATTDILLDTSGSQTRQKVDDDAAALATKYGAPRKGANCTGTQDECSTLWPLEVMQGAANYAYLWTFNGPPRDDKIASVVLAAAASGPSRTYVALEYDSANAEACAEASKAAKAAGL